MCVDGPDDRESGTITMDRNLVSELLESGVEKLELVGALFYLHEVGHARPAIDPNSRDFKDDGGRYFNNDKDHGDTRGYELEFTAFQKLRLYRYNGTNIYFINMKLMWKDWQNNKWEFYNRIYEHNGL